MSILGHARTTTVYRPIFVYLNWEAIIMSPDLKAGVVLLTPKTIYI